MLFDVFFRFEFESCMVWRLWVRKLVDQVVFAKKWGFRAVESIQRVEGDESQSNFQNLQIAMLAAKCLQWCLTSSQAPLSQKRCADPGVLHQSSLQ